MDKEIKKMTIEELDDYIERLPRIFMKAIRYQQVKKIRPDYVPKHIRNKKKEGIK
jgi:hypothetical protein